MGWRLSKFFSTENKAMVPVAKTCYVVHVLIIFHHILTASWQKVLDFALQPLLTQFNRTSFLLCFDLARIYTTICFKHIIVLMGGGGNLKRLNLIKQKSIMCFKIKKKKSDFFVSNLFLCSSVHLLQKPATSGVIETLSNWWWCFTLSLIEDDCGGLMALHGQLLW